MGQINIYADGILELSARACFYSWEILEFYIVRLIDFRLYEGEMNNPIDELALIIILNIASERDIISNR